MKPDSPQPNSPQREFLEQLAAGELGPEAIEQRLASDPELAGLAEEFERLGADLGRGAEREALREALQGIDDADRVDAEKFFRVRLERRSSWTSWQRPLLLAAVLIAVVVVGLRLPRGGESDQPRLLGEAAAESSIVELIVGQPVDLGVELRPGDLGLLEFPAAGAQAVVFELERLPWAPTAEQLGRVPAAGSLVLRIERASGAFEAPLTRDYRIE